MQARLQWIDNNRLPYDQRPVLHMGYCIGRAIRLFPNATPDEINRLAREFLNEYYFDEEL